MSAFSTSHPSGWRPTASHVRASLLAAGLLVAAVLLHRADLVVMATPLAVLAVWSNLSRPTTPPTVSTPRALPALREGESMTWHAEVTPVAGMEQVGLVMAANQFLAIRPEHGTLARAVAPGSAEVRLAVGVRTTRWGVQAAGACIVAATSSFGAYRWGPIGFDGKPLTTLPLPAVFNATAPTPRPVGLVGLNRGARPGDGTEFASIRPFQIGDRLRRIHWPVSLRTGNLHVTATWSDQDAQVVLVVDATTDLGVSEGLDGAASSLDVTVRAAGAIAEHYLRRGDRVGLRVLGIPGQLRMTPAAGNQQLLRILHQLAAVTAGDRERRDQVSSRLGLGAGTLVVMLSACVSSLALQQAVALASRGLTTVVVDTLPERIAGVEDPYVVLAWRIRRLERAMEMRRVVASGVPIVPWHGPGSLDQVLRDAGRRSAAPRLARR